MKTYMEAPMLFTTDTIQMLYYWIYLVFCSFMYLRVCPNGTDDWFPNNQNIPLLHIMELLLFISSI